MQGGSQSHHNLSLRKIYYELYHYKLTYFILYRYELTFFESLCKKVVVVSILGGTVTGSMARRRMMRHMARVEVAMTMGLGYTTLG